MKIYATISIVFFCLNPPTDSLFCLVPTVSSCLAGSPLLCGLSESQRHPRRRRGGQRGARLRQPGLPPPDQAQVGPGPPCLRLAKLKSRADKAVALTRAEIKDAQGNPLPKPDYWHAIDLVLHGEVLPALDLALPRHLLATARRVDLPKAVVGYDKGR